MKAPKHPLARASEFFPAQLNSSPKLKNQTSCSLSFVDSRSPSSLRFSLSLSPSHPFSSPYISDSLSLPFSLSPLSQTLPLSQTQSLSIPSLSQLRSPKASHPHSFSIDHPRSTNRPPHHIARMYIIFWFFFFFFMLGVRVLACW